MPEFLAKPTPHERAAGFLRSLPTVDRETFDKLPSEFKASAFLISGIQAHDVLQDCRDLLATVPEGADFETVRAQLQAKLEPLMGGNSKAAKARSLIVARFHVNRAYTLGTVAQLDNHKAAFPFRKRLTAGDDRVRDSHAALNGVILPADSPSWEFLTPPGPGYNCRCFIVGVSRRDAEKVKTAEAAAVTAGTLDPAQVKFVDGPMLKQLEESQILTRGLSEQYKFSDLTTFNPRSLLMPVDQIEARYDKQTWEDFQKWSQATPVDDESSLWDHLIAQRPSTVARASSPQSRPAKPQPPPDLPAPETIPAPEPEPVEPATSPAVARASSPQSLPPTVPADPSPAAQIGAHLDTESAPPAVQEAVAQASRAAAEVHSDGGLAETIIDDAPAGDVLGSYNPADSRIALAPDSPVPVTGALHEIAHKIHHEAITPQPAAVTAHKAIIAALEDTPVAARIRAEADPDARDYLLHPNELFARAYAQYIAARGSDADVKREIAEILAGQHDDLFTSLWHWPADQFAKLIPLFDALLRALGWIK